MVGRFRHLHCHLRGAVAAAVIHHENMDGAAVALLQQRFQAAANHRGTQESAGFEGRSGSMETRTTNLAPSRASLKTVSVPEQFREVFARAEDYVRRYFKDRVENPEESTISISGERYILVRAASMSVEFFDLVVSLYQDKGEQEARSVANNLLFDIAHAIGKADAKSFHTRMGVDDPVDRLSAGPVHFAFSGWASVDILPASAPSPDENYYLIYNHPFSFES